MQKWSQITKSFSLPVQTVYLLTFTIFITHLLTLTLIKSKVYDEIYYASAARSYLAGGIVFDVHPPFGKEIMAIGILFFGDNSFGWRFITSLLHTLLIPLTYLVGNELFKNKRLSLLAASLLAGETMLYVLGQVALLEISVAFFLLLAVYLMLVFLRTRRGLFLALFSLAIGAALGTKWTALGPALIMVIYLGWKIPTARWRSLGSCLLIIMATYLLTFWPHFLRNENIWLWHLSTAGYHLTFPKYHPFQSAWWTWPLDYRGVLLYFQENQTVIRGLYLIGNPVIFLLQLFAVGFIFMKKQWSVVALPLMLFISGLLEWIPTSKGFIYNFAPALPFGLLLITHVLGQEKFREVRIYLLVSVGLFWLFFLPLMIGLFIPKWFFYWHLLPVWR